MAERLTTLQTIAVVQHWEALANVPTSNPNSNDTVRSHFQSELSRTQEIFNITEDEARARLAEDVRREKETNIYFGDPHFTAARLLEANLPFTEAIEIYDARLEHDVQLGAHLLKTVAGNIHGEAIVREMIKRDEDALAEFRRMTGRRTGTADTY